MGNVIPDTPPIKTGKKTIVIDLDGTLVNSDMLIENLLLFIRLYPFRILEIFIWLFRGKAYLKKSLADEVMPDATTLPYNNQLLSWLAKQRSEGARLVLATASDARIAGQIAGHLGLFDETFGTDILNLSSRNKRDLLNRKYGHKGYEYVGNSAADLAVWESASAIHVVNPEYGVLAAVGKIGKIDNLFESSTSYLHSLLKALRLHQWTKNLLIFVPLLASHRVFETQLILSGLLAFIAYGACASSVYLLNDLLDLPEDRRHPTKYKRSLASGHLPIKHGLLLAPILLIFAFGVAGWFLPFQFTMVLSVYYVLTLAYSLRLKRIVMLDVITLAILYTIRVIAGATAMAMTATFWILTFCMFIFLSLAFLKRYTELSAVRDNVNINTMNSGRGYYPGDFELLASLGGASGYISVLVLALYINESTTGHLYRSPEWMWVACPLLLFWLSRIWLLAHRGQMNDDPIVFALQDKVSLIIGVSFLMVFGLASL